MPFRASLALERLAVGLRKVTHPGPVAKDIADSFRADAPGTVAEFRVVRNTLEKSPTPFGFVRAQAKC